MELRYTLPAAALFFSNDAASATSRSLVELLEDRQIFITATAMGGHMGESIRVEVRNRTNGDLRTNIPPGWRFVSVDPGVQDLIVVREEVLVIAGGAITTVTCRAFCCQASGRSPEMGDPFRAGHQAGKQLTQLAMSIAKGAFEDDYVQDAVWVLSDGLSIAGMGAMETNERDSLRVVVSRLSGQPVPLYSLRYAEDPGRACSGRPAMISRTYRIGTPVPTVLNAVVIGPNGNPVHVLYHQHALEAGDHVLPLEVDVTDLPEGRYAIHAYTTYAPGVARMPFEL